MINLPLKSLVGLFLDQTGNGGLAFLKRMITLSNAMCILQYFCLKIPLHKPDGWDLFSFFMRTTIDIFGRSAI